MTTSFEFRKQEAAKILANLAARVESVEKLLQECSSHWAMKTRSIASTTRASKCSGATRGRRWDCDNVMSPTVLPVVSYRDVRRWQRRGAKLPRQRILTLRSGRESVSRHGDCQHRGGRDPGGGGTVNPGEASLNVVTKDKPKVLTGLGQKARGQVRRLRTPPAQMAQHRRRDATYTTQFVPPAERGKPVALLYSHSKGNRKMT